jgi:hypothetical protein
MAVPPVVDAWPRPKIVSFGKKAVTRRIPAKVVLRSAALESHKGRTAESEGRMLRFLKETPVYDFEFERLRFVGLDRDRHVICRISKDALLACLDSDNATGADLLAAFESNRTLFEDIASMEHAAGSREEVYIERFHLEHPWLKIPAMAAMARA